MYRYPLWSDDRSDKDQRHLGRSVRTCFGLDAPVHRESYSGLLSDVSHVEKIYIRTGTDMRKPLNGLVDIIQYDFKLDPYSSMVFFFCGRRTDRIKAVHYEGKGFCLLYKRYENGRLKCPRCSSEVSLDIVFEYFCL